MAQHAILRFEKHKGNPARPLEAHHERQKDQYASNPDIDTSRSKYNTCPGGRAKLQAEKGRARPSQAARALGAFFASLTRPQAGQTRASGGDTAPAQ